MRGGTYILIHKAPKIVQTDLIVYRDFVNSQLYRFSACSVTTSFQFHSSP